MIANATTKLTLNSETRPGTLYIVGTPIGNLDDITFRAIQTLQTVDLIAAEDTRHTGKLLHHFQIKTPQISYHDHNRHHRTAELLQRLQQGTTIALVSDAGMPTISDPGYELVQACIGTQIPVVPIPGATAAIVALSASGLPSDRFIFEGFLPPKTKDRQAHLAKLRAETRTLIFYEAPHRLLKTLADMVLILEADEQSDSQSNGQTNSQSSRQTDNQLNRQTDNQPTDDQSNSQSNSADPPTQRRVTIARELTKLHEELWHGTLRDAIAHYTHHPPQGEFTLVLAGAPVVEKSITETMLRAELQQLIQQGLSRSEASRQLAAQTAVPRRQIYQLALQLGEN